METDGHPTWPKTMGRIVNWFESAGVEKHCACMLMGWELGAAAHAFLCSKQGILTMNIIIHILRILGFS